MFKNPGTFRAFKYFIVVCDIRLTIKNFTKT